jgi:hypothetical protein
LFLFSDLFNLLWLFFNLFFLFSLLNILHFNFLGRLSNWLFGCLCRLSLSDCLCRNCCCLWLGSAYSSRKRFSLSWSVSLYTLSTQGFLQLWLPWAERRWLSSLNFESCWDSSRTFAIIDSWFESQLFQVFLILNVFSLNILLLNFSLSI